MKIPRKSNFLPNISQTTQRGARPLAQRLCTCLIVSSVALAPVALADTIIHAGRVFDSTSAKIVREQTLRIKDDRIVSRSAGYAPVGGDDELIDLKGSTVMPGWIDMHVHIDGQLSPEAYSERFRLGPADSALRGAAYAERTLMAGFTRVRDLGTTDGVAQSIRNAVAAGFIKGPRVFTAGKSLATTGGHADPTNGVRPELRENPGPAEGVVNGVEDAFKAVRQRYKEGADLIKLTATGGVLSQAKSGDNPQFTEAELEAIISAARDYGFRVAAHAHGTKGMERAIRAGVDSIEHGTFMTKDTIKLMKKMGTYYVPTILAGEFVAQKAQEPGYFSELVRPKAIAIGPTIKSTFKEAYEAGVKIAFGTDTGVSAHGDNWQEFPLMIEAGMPALVAVQTATRNAAQLLDQWDQLGSLDAGKFADIVAVEGNIEDDPELFGKVSFIMKNGVRYR